MELDSEEGNVHEDITVKYNSELLSGDNSFYSNDLIIIL